MKIEIANGIHPFSSLSSKDFCGLYMCIVVNEPPCLDDKKFSPEFCSFVQKWYPFFQLQ